LKAIAVFITEAMATLHNWFLSFRRLNYKMFPEQMFTRTAL